MIIQAQWGSPYGCSKLFTTKDFHLTGDGESIFEIRLKDARFNYRPNILERSIRTEASPAVSASFFGSRRCVEPIAMVRNQMLVAVYHLYVPAARRSQAMSPKSPCE